MLALTLVADRKLELVDLPAPPPPQANEVQIRVRAVGLNHIDVWGFRGMAFAKRKLPLVIGAEASGEIRCCRIGRYKLQAWRSRRHVWRDDLRNLQGVPRRPRQSV